MALETQRQRRPPRPGESSASGLAGNLKPATASPPTAQEYLNNCRSFYSCIYCRTHLANHDELVSRSFQGNRSRAYLFNSVVNMSCGAPVQRELNTGSHAVADIFCTNCGTTVGWKYEKAYEDSQKYKEGKFIIELVHVVRENRHLELDKRDTFKSLLAQQAGPALIEQVATTSPSFGWTGGGGLGGYYQYRNHNRLQGSLSPPRPYSWSSASGQQASSSTSSSSSSSSSASSCSSSSSSSSPNNPRTRDARVRYNSSGQYEEDHDDQDEPEHEEALMFPFYDDLYGNRSSYSNLSTSLSYFQRRLRRSLQMASAPMQPPPLPLPLGDDWKQHAHRPSERCDAAGPANSTSSIDIPSKSTGEGRRTLVAAPGPGADQNDNDDPHAKSGETQFELEHEHGQSAPSCSEQNCDRSQGDASESNDEIGTTTTTTTSQDDEEFYDCCTDHDVA